MTETTFDAVEHLRRLLADGALTAETIEAITGIRPAALQAFTARPDDWSAVLSHDEMGRLTMLVGQLVLGFDIPDDERVQGVLDALVLQFRMTHASISAITGITVETLEAWEDDPTSVAAEDRYRLGNRLTSLLLGAIGNARPSS